MNVWRIGRLIIAVLIGLGLASVLATENALRIPERPRPQAGEADAVARETGSTWQSVQVTADDGAVMDAWFFTPRAPSGSTVLLLHGVADTRTGMLVHADYLLRRGFAVLDPDLRGHGSSGGALTTYGIKEAADVRSWSDWVLENRPSDRWYGLGESLGAAILLQSLRLEPRFRAVVAECPFATFDEVASDRMSQFSGVWRPAFWPLVHSGFLYARVRYGLDLRQASPAAAVRYTNVPILLIHGTSDTHIPLRHSRELHALNPRATELWEVPGAEHVGALGTQPETYIRTVTEWFRSHP